MIPRFTSGNVGRLTYEHVNRMADATERVERMSSNRKRQHGPQPLRPMLVQLLADMGYTVGGRKVWSWRELAVSAGPNRQVDTFIPESFSSLEFQSANHGQAILLTGDAIAGDIVTLVPLVSRIGEPWYGFNGAPRVQVSMLEITDSISNPNDDESPRWIYNVTPVLMNQIGALIVNPYAPSGIAFNGYEFTRQQKKYWGHGQKLSWPSTPNSRLEVDGPVIGIVHGVLVQPASGAQQAVWNFDAPVPLRPVCQVPTAMVQGKMIDVMQRGIA